MRMMAMTAFETADSRTNQEARYTVVVPAYNASETVERAIKSVRAQTMPSWRLVVVDDGSTDNTLAVAERLARGDPAIRVIHQANAGVASARNTAIERSRTEFVTFLDADDELDPEYLRMMDEFIGAYPGYDIYHSNLRILAPDGSESLFSDCAVVTSFDLGDLLKECVIGIGATMRTSSLRGLGGFRSGIHCEDYDLWLRALADGQRAIYLPSPLYLYHQEHAIRRSANSRAGVTDLIASIEELLTIRAIPRELVPSALDAIDRNCRLLSQLDSEAEMRAQADRFYGRLEQLLGGKGTRLAQRLTSRLRRHVVPIRRRMAERQALKRDGQ